jgi:predicted transcriptional regulator
MTKLTDAEWAKARRKMIDEANAEADKGVFISQKAVHAWMETWDTVHETPPPEPDVFLKWK